MLFSDVRIAQIASEGFEPVWQSVRPVPIVTIDFGEGRKIKRTLHGYIATYVCTPSGKVIDVLPGLYTAEVYVQRLLALYFEAQSAPKSDKEFATWFAEQQKKRVEAGRKKQPPKPEKKAPRDISKSITIERPVMWALGAPPAVEKVAPEVVAALEDEGRLSVWKAMIQDTRINDSQRRRQICGYLLEKGPTAPADMTKWLYREVLDSDIDDPWLGLKSLSDASVFSSVENPAK